MSELNIKSSTIEKGLESAKNFVNKLIGPAIEECGLLIKDQISFWRFKNQVKVVNKTKDFCEKHNIKPREVSLKLLCPLLDYAGLEEDEKLQDKWAILLSNLVDSEQNIQNHVFPYILSQISINEFDVIERAYNDKLMRVNRLQEEIVIFDKQNPNKETKLIEEIQTMKDKLVEPKDSYQDIEARKVIWDLDKKLRDLRYERNRLVAQMELDESINYSSMQEFEIGNLVRLGLIKYLEENRAIAESVEIEHPDAWSSKSKWIDLDISIESENSYYSLTQLGELFIAACSEKTTIKV